MPKKGVIFSVSLLVIAEIFALFYMYKSNDNEITDLATVNLKEEIDSNNMFAIMLEQSDGTYKESTDNVWPEDMEYNAEKSGCVDVNGNKIVGVLTYDSENKLATVDTTSTSYCYLYFNLPPLTVSVTVTDNNTNNVALNVLSNKDGTYCLIKESVSTTECISTGTVNANETLTIGNATLSIVTAPGSGTAAHGSSFNTTFTVIITDSSGATAQESVVAAAPGNSTPV